MQSNRKKLNKEEQSNQERSIKQNIISSTAKNLVVLYQENTKDVLQNFSCSTWLKSLSMVLMGSAMAKADEIVLQAQQETQYLIKTPLTKDDRLHAGLCNLVSPTFETLSWENLFSLSDPRNNKLLVQLSRGLGQNITDAEECVTGFLQTRYDEFMEAVNEENEEVKRIFIILGSIALGTFLCCCIIGAVCGFLKKNPEENKKLIEEANVIAVAATKIIENPETSTPRYSS